MTIHAIKVERDSNGYWTHPSIPKWNDDTTDQEITQWEKDNGIRISTIYFEDTASDELIVRLFDQDDQTALTEWEPEIPSGGFLLGIHCTEESGPIALVANPTGHMEAHP